MANVNFDTIDYSQIFNTSWTSQANENSPVSNWVIGDAFIFAHTIFSGISAAPCNKAYNANQFRVEFQASDNVGVWVQVGASTEISWGSGLFTDDSSDSTKRIASDPSAGQCATGFAATHYNDGDNTLPDSGGISSAAETYRNLAWH